MEIVDWLFNKTNKTDNNSITDSDVDLLLDTPNVKFTEDIRKRIKQKIKENWSTRENKKPIQELIQELLHPCTKYQLEATFDTNSKFMSTFYKLRDSVDEAQIAALNTNFLAVAKIFMEGFFSVFKENFIFKNGKIVDVKPTNTNGEPDPRFIKCRESLEESRKYARNESNAFKSNQGLNRKINSSNNSRSLPPTTPDPANVEGDRNRASSSSSSSSNSAQPPSFGGYKRQTKTKRRHTRRHTRRRRSYKKKSFNS